MSIPAQIVPQIAGYTLETRIGGGSSGEVWRALSGDQIVAVKFLKDSLLNSPQRDKHLRRFRTEITALSRLAAMPHIPTLLDYALDSERPYLVMEYVDGEGFGRLLESGEMLQIPLRHRLTLLHGIGQALDAAHEARVLHRDIKPSNIRGTDQAWLLDFSVALDLTDSDDDLKERVGTRLYKPPQPCDPGALFRDRFGFAVVCYEVLFGRHPFFVRDELQRYIDELEDVARLRLWSKTWYRPTSFGEATLPPNLAGAHLDDLEQLFQRAFESDAYKGAAVFVDALRAVIDVPENEGFIEALPARLPADLTGDDYTELEMQVQAARTEAGAPPVRRWWWLGIVAALLLIGLLTLWLLNFT